MDNSLRRKNLTPKDRWGRTVGMTGPPLDFSHENHKRASRPAGESNQLGGDLTPHEHAGIIMLNGTREMRSNNLAVSPHPPKGPLEVFNWACTPEGLMHVTWSIRAPQLINSTPKPNTTLSITDVVNRAVFRFSDPAILVRRSLKERNSLNLRAILCFVCSVEDCGHNRHPCLAPWCLFKNARSCAS